MLGRRHLLLALLLTLAPGAARADDTHHHDYPIGGRAVGLGGAFVALSDDPSGIYYNPAGIVDAPRTSLQVSTNLYGLEIAVGGDVLRSLFGTLTDIDRVFADLQIIPTTAGFIEGLGPARADGTHDHAFGLAAFVPSYRSLRLETSGPGTSAGEVLAYRRDLLDRTLQGAAAYGMRIDDTWSFGFSGSVLIRTVRDEEESSLGVASGGLSGTQSYLDAVMAALLFTVGIKARVDDRWSVGLAVTSPSLQVWSGAKVRVTRSVFDPATGASGFRLYEPDGVESEMATGAAVRAGFSFQLGSLGLFSGDLVLHAPVRYRLVELPVDAAEAARILTLATDIERRLVVNANAGFEAPLDDDLALAFGFFTNFSSAPPIDGAPGDRFSGDRLPDLDAFGGSIVLTVFGELTKTRGGLLASYAVGPDVIAQSKELLPLGEGGDFHKIQLEQLTLFFFLSTTLAY
jgi:hypothetical protein